MDAIQLLLADHRKIKNLFKQFRSKPEDTQLNRVIDQIATEIKAHTRVEESIFYPACNEYPECSELVMDLVDDHEEAKRTLAEMEALPRDSEDRFDMAEDLVDDIEGHIEEEEQELFPLVRELMQPVQLDDLGDRIQDARRDESDALKKSA